jgi:hypothetical protein
MSSDASGVCVVLYNAIFPKVNVAQLDGTYPWGADEAVVNRPDAYNLLTIKNCPG